MKTYNRGRCSLCGYPLSNAGFAVAAHNRAHVKRGELIELYRYNFRGVVIDKKIVRPEEVEAMRARDYFASFDEARAEFAK